jgi:hypothetical protein
MSDCIPVLLGGMYAAQWATHRVSRTLRRIVLSLAVQWNTVDRIPFDPLMAVPGEGASTRRGTRVGACQGTSSATGSMRGYAISDASGSKGTRPVEIARS